MYGRRSRRTGVWLFTGLLAVSIGVNVLQAQRIRELVDRPADTRLVGTQVGSLVGTTAGGERVTVALGTGQPVVIYHFSTSCVWCEGNWANLQALAEHADGRYRVVAVTTETGIEDYVASRGLPFEILEGVSTETARRLGLSGTPNTIVVGRDGLVSHQWYGAYTNRTGRQVGDLFGLELPGLETVRAAAADPQ